MSQLESRAHTKVVLKAVHDFRGLQGEVSNDEVNVI